MDIRLIQLPSLVHGWLNAKTVVWFDKMVQLLGCQKLPERPFWKRANKGVPLLLYWNPACRIVSLCDKHIYFVKKDMYNIFCDPPPAL